MQWEHLPLLKHNTGLHHTLLDYIHYLVKLPEGILLIHTTNQDLANPINATTKLCFNSKVYQLSEMIT